MLYTHSYTIAIAFAGKIQSAGCQDGWQVALGLLWGNKTHTLNDAIGIAIVAQVLYSGWAKGRHPCNTI